MAKKIGLIVAIVVVIAGLIGVSIYLKNNPVEASSEESSLIIPTTENTYLLGAREKDNYALKVTIANADDTYTVTQNDAAMAVIEGLEEYNLASAQVILEKANGLIAMETVEENASRLADFGLDKPLAIVAVTYLDTKTTTLKIGNAAPGGAGTYVTSDDKNVYLVSNTSIEPFLQTALSYFPLVVTPGHPEQTYFTKVVLGGSVREEEIIIEPVNPDEVIETSGIVLHSHNVVSPISATMDVQKGQDLFAPLFNLVADEVVSVSEEGEILITEPYSTITVGAKNVGQGEESAEYFFTLSTTEPDSEGMVNLAVDGVNVLYRVSTSKLPWLSTQAFELRNRMILLPFIDNVAALTIATPDRSETFDLTFTEVESDGEEKKEDVVFTHKGKPLDDKNFRQYYQTILSTRFDKPFDGELNREEVQPILTITYRYRDGRQDAIFFYPTDEPRTYLAALNDESPHFVASTQFDRILEDLDNVIEGKKVVSAI